MCVVFVWVTVLITRSMCNWLQVLTSGLDARNTALSGRRKATPWAHSAQAGCLVATTSSVPSFVVRVAITHLITGTNIWASVHSTSSGWHCYSTIAQVMPCMWQQHALLKFFFLPFSFCDLLRAGSTSCMHTLLWRTFTVFQCANCANPSSLCHEWPHSLHTMRMSISGRFFEPHVSLFPMSRMLERYPHFASRALQRGHENFVLAIIPLWSSRMAASSLWTQTNQPNKHRNRGAEWLQHAAQHSTPRRTSPVDHPKTLDTLGLLAAAA